MEFEELPDEIICYIFHSKVSVFFSSSSSSSSLLATDPHVLLLVSKRWNRIFTQSFVFEEQHFNRFVLKPCGLTPSSRIEPERIPLVTTTCRRLFLALGRLSKLSHRPIATLFSPPEVRLQLSILRYLGPSYKSLQLHNLPFHLSSFNRRLFFTFPEWDRVQIHNFEEEFNFEETPEIAPEVFLATPRFDFISELQIEGNPTFVTLNRAGNALVLVNKGHNALEIDPESGRFIQSFPLCGLDSDPDHLRFPTYHLNHLSPATVFEGQLFAVDPTRKLTGQLLSFPVDNLLEEELEKDRKASSASISMPTPSTTITSSSSDNSYTSTEGTETVVTEKGVGNGRRAEEEFDDNIFDFVAAEEELDRQLQRQTELVAKISETTEIEEETPPVSDDNNAEKDTFSGSSDDWRESRDEPFSWMEKLNPPALVPTVSIISIEATRKRTNEEEGLSEEEWLQRKMARRDEERREGEREGKDIARTELGERQKKSQSAESQGQDEQVDELEEEEEEEIADTTYFYKLDGAEALKPEPLAVDLLGNVICLYESQMVVLMPRNNKQREVLRHFWSPASSPIPVSPTSFSDKEDKPHLQLVCIDPYTGHLIVTTKTGLCYIF